MTTTTRPATPHNRTAVINTNAGRRRAVAPPARRVRLPELAVGVFVTVAFALAAVLWHLNTTAKVPALAAADTIARGDIIEAQDLRVTYVTSGDSVVYMGSAESAQVVGRVAVVDLAPGTLLTPTVITDGGGLSVGDGVVGLALDPGQYPAFGLSAGDRVNVVGSDPAEPSGAAGGTRALVAAATVFAVEDLTGDRKLVSVLMSEEDTEVVAGAAAGDGIRLVLVAP